jgi:ornithine decarboxylase
VNIGGGSPVRYLSDVPALEQLFAVIRAEVQSLFPQRSVELWVEPGRAIAGDAAIAATSVLGIARRHNRNWVFCDLGAFNGLLELIEPSNRGFEYEVRSDRRRDDGDVREYVLAGPSCDGDDVLARKVKLPALAPGDRLYFLKTSAYSFVYAPTFCGNARPQIHVV